MSSLEVTWVLVVPCSGFQHGGTVRFQDRRDENEDPPEGNLRIISR